MQLSYQDQEHLRLLSIFHYIAAGLIGLLSCIPLLYLLIGLLVAAGTLGQDKSGAGAIIGGFFAVFGLFIAVIGWTMAVLIGLAGKFIAQRRNYIYCMVIAGLLCFHAPLGTILGVFTFVVLLRPEVKAVFEGQAAPVPPAPAPPAV